MAEASAHLKGRVVPEEDRTGKAALVLEISDPVKVGLQEGSGRLLFDRNTKKLYMIVLTFSAHDRSASGCFAGIEAADERLRIRRVSAVSDKLVDRYGKPAIEKGAWPSRAGLIDYFVRRSLNNLAAARIWKDAGQAIEARMDLACGSLFLNVIYRAVGSEL
jgi:hypothetical protein